MDCDGANTCDNATVLTTAGLLFDEIGRSTVLQQLKYNREDINQNNRRDCLQTHLDLGRH